MMASLVVAIVGFILPFVALMRAADSQVRTHAPSAVQVLYPTTLSSIEAQSSTYGDWGHHDGTTDYQRKLTKKTLTTYHYFLCLCAAYHCSVSMQAWRQLVSYSMATLIHSILGIYIPFNYSHTCLMAC